MGEKKKSFRAQIQRKGGQTIPRNSEGLQKKNHRETPKKSGDTEYDPPPKAG